MTDEEFNAAARANPVEAAACLKLWLRVLDTNLLTSRVGGGKYKAYHAVENSRSQSWIGSPDFEEVCDLAGFDPATVALVARSGRFEDYRRRPPRFCSLPSCAREIDPRNRTTVCAKHQHTPGYCRCRRCSWWKAA